MNLDLYHAIENNDLEAAQKVFYKQLNLLKFIVNKGLPRAIKAGLEIQGIEGGFLRSPLKPLTATEIEDFKLILKEIEQ